MLVLNEHGDFLSGMASALVGSLGTGASGNFPFSEDRSVDIAMFDPAGGMAPDIAGKNICNPAAILLSFDMLLDHIDRYHLGHTLRTVRSPITTARETLVRSSIPPSLPR